MIRFFRVYTWNAARQCFGELGLRKFLRDVVGFRPESNPMRAKTSGLIHPIP